MAERQPPSTRPLAIERRGAVLLVGLDRTHKRNAINDETIEALDECFSTLPSDVKAAVIHGVGPHFSAGLDLSEISERDVTAGVFHSRGWHRVVREDRVRAHSRGRGPEGRRGRRRARIGGRDARARRRTFGLLRLARGQRGIFVGGGGSVRLPRLIGVHRMADMMLTGRTYGAAEGVALGFSQYLVEDGEGFAKGLALAEAMAGNAPLTNFAVIQALPRIAESDPRVGYLMELLMAAVAQGDGEAKARVNAFLEKRAAKVSRPD